MMRCRVPQIECGKIQLSSNAIAPGTSAQPNNQQIIRLPSTSLVRVLVFCQIKMAIGTPNRISERQRLHTSLNELTEVCLKKKGVFSIEKNCATSPIPGRATHPMSVSYTHLRA